MANPSTLKGLLLLVLCPLFANTQNCRYYLRIFPTVTKTSNVAYATAPGIPAIYISEAVTTNQTLTMDIFQPDADTAQKRAMIIFAHSGGFINGSKDNADMQALCDSFAHMGYVTATINYRKNFNLLSSSSSERAVWRGIQDASAAVRYFKNFATTYKIDTGNIFFWGSSAGAFMSLGLAYLDDPERPASTYSAFLQPDLGCKNCTGNAYAFPSTVKSIVSCWGATKDTAWIQSNNDIPAVLFHGTSDATVPYTEGYPFGLPTIAYVRGSQQINQQMNRTSIYHEFYSETGLGHEYWGTSNGSFPPGGPNFFWTDIIIKSKLFLIGRIGGPLSCVNLPVSVSGFTGQLLSGNVNLEWKTGSEENLEKMILEKSADGINYHPLIEIAPKDRGSNGALYQATDKDPYPGVVYYRLKLVDKNNTYTYSGVLKFLSPVLYTRIIRVYPNPVSDRLILNIVSSKKQTLNARIIDQTGRQVSAFNLSLANGLNTFTIPFTRYSAGIYSLLYSDERGNIQGSVRVIKGNKY